MTAMAAMAAMVPITPVVITDISVAPVISIIAPGVPASIVPFSIVPFSIVMPVSWITIRTVIVSAVWSIIVSGISVILTVIIPRIISIPDIETGPIMTIGSKRYINTCFSFSRPGDNQSQQKRKCDCNVT
jgi:hypothetical protein